MSRKTNKLIKRILRIIGILLMLFAFGCAIYVGVMQVILGYEKFGVIFTNDTVIIVDKSLWWLLGVLALFPGQLSYIEGTK